RGETAVELLRKERFDLMVLDYKMPGMTGFDVYQQAKALYPDLAVVLVTGHGSPEVVTEANRLGFDSILLKPFTSDELRGTVEKGAPNAPRRDVHVLDVGCGPGNFTFVLAEAGFSTIGLEAYGALVELAREKRRAKRLANLAFRHGELAAGAGGRDASFDALVNIHGIYVHPEPVTLLREARRVLKPGGH